MCYLGHASFCKCVTRFGINKMLSFVHMRSGIHRSARKHVFGNELVAWMPMPSCARGPLKAGGHSVVIKLLYSFWMESTENAASCSTKTRWSRSVRPVCLGLLELRVLRHGLQPSGNPRHVFEAALSTRLKLALKLPMHLIPIRKSSLRAATKLREPY